MSISAVIAIKDELETYKESIDSVYDFVDEIIVADIGMSREMRDVLERLKKIRFVRYKRGISYIELIRQKVINKATSEWILYLDPDEVVPKSLIKFLVQHSADYDYFSIPRKNIILGNWMLHSRWWPDRQVRFFKKNAAQWNTTIHSQPTLSGKGCDVPADEKYALIHKNYLDYDQYAEKSRRYAKAEAKKITAEGNFTLTKALQLGLSEFISRFFKDDGYKDGMHGFVMAFSQLLYYFQVYVYYWEKNGYKSTQHVAHVPFHFFSQSLYETLHWMQAKEMFKSAGKHIKAKVLSVLLKR